MIGEPPVEPPVEHALLRDAVRAFLAAELPPERVRALDEARRVPRELWRRLGALGWMGLSIPERYGGAGADTATTAVVVEELARAFPSVAGDYVLAAMVARLLGEHGTERQLEQLLPGIASGERMVAVALTEPGAGTDLLALRTHATLGDDGWAIRGQKLYTTMAEEADALIVLARTDPVEPTHRARGLTLLIVPREQPAVEVRRLRLMAMRASGTCEVFLDGAHAPADAFVGRRGRGFHQLLGMLDAERVLGAAIALGIAGAALDLAVAYARTRVAFGRPIGALQAIQHPLADSAVELAAARLLAAEAARLVDGGRPASHASAMAKVAASEAALRGTDRGMRVLAAHGLTEESPMGMLLRDARMQAFSPLSNEMARNVIGEQLGLPRSY